MSKKQFWVGTWQSSPTGVPNCPVGNPHTVYTPTSVQGTIRYRLRISQGGSHVPIRLSNEYGKKPLEIGAVSVGLAGKDFAALPGTLMPVTFAGNSGISIPAGAPALLDPVDLPVNSLSDLVVSLYLPDGVDMLAQSIQVNTAVIDGANLTLSETLLPSKPIAARPLVSAIDVLAEGSPRVVVAFGDSITDGVIDFDVAMCDPSHTGKLRVDYDVGDGLHPSFAGYRAMADSVDARLFDCD